MTNDPAKPVSIAICNNVSEADMLKIALEEQGIDATIDGAALNTTFGSMAGPVIAGVKIIVRQEDASEAVSIINATREAYVAPVKEKWFCGKCLEEVEGSFEVCWSCSLPRDEIEAPFPSTATVVEAMDFPKVDTDELGRSSENPYESPRAMGVADENEDDELSPEAKAMESNFILGLLFSGGSLFLPILPALAAVAMFRFAFRKKLPMTMGSKVAFVTAIVILVASHLVWLWIWQFPNIER